MGNISSCIDCPVRQLGIFSTLKNDELTGIKDLPHLNFCKKRQIIFHEDNRCHGFYVLRTGRAKLVKSSRTGRQQIVKIVNPGEVMGEDAIFGGRSYSFTAETMEDSEICFINKEEFSTFLMEKPDVSLRFMSILSAELRAARAQIIDMALKDARERMAGLMLDLADEYGRSEKDGIHLGLSLTRNDIAEIIGVSQETAIRLLSEFKDNGLIRTCRRQITILDEDKMKLMVDGEQGVSEKSL